MINYIKARITYRTLNEWIECVKEIPTITEDEIKSVEYTRDIIKQWLVIYEYNHHMKKKAWKRFENEG